MTRSLLIANRGEIARHIIRRTFLRAFASSREPNSFFSRGDAEARRRIAPPSGLRPATSPSKLWEDFLG